MTVDKAIESGSRFLDRQGVLGLFALAAVVLIGVYVYQGMLWNEKLVDVLRQQHETAVATIAMDHKRIATIDSLRQANIETAKATARMSEILQQSSEYEEQRIREVQHAMLGLIEAIKQVEQRSRGQL